jgi:hypothetical protein
VTTHEFLSGNAGRACSLCHLLANPSTGSGDKIVLKHMSFNDAMKDDVKSLTKHIKIPGRSCIHLEFRYCSGVGLLLYTVARYKLPITSIAMIGLDADDLEYDLNGLEVFIHAADS